MNSTRSLICLLVFAGSLVLLLAGFDNLLDFMAGEPGFDLSRTALIPLGLGAWLTGCVIHDAFGTWKPEHRPSPAPINAAKR